MEMIRENLGNSLRNKPTFIIKLFGFIWYGFLLTFGIGITFIFSFILKDGFTKTIKDIFTEIKELILWDGK